jgi:hypothetical protein
MPQPIHAGKNDPRILNEGAREHPATNSIGAKHAAGTAARLMPRPSSWREFPVNVFIHFAMSFGGIGLWPFRMKQVAGLES